MNLEEGMLNLWNSTGIMNFVKTADPSLGGIDQFLHQFGSPIMILICLFLLWLGIKTI